jgi:hypothetical protein
MEYKDFSSRIGRINGTSPVPGTVLIACGAQQSRKLNRGAFDLSSAA